MTTITRGTRTHEEMYAEDRACVDGFGPMPSFDELVKPILSTIFRLGELESVTHSLCSLVESGGGPENVRYEAIAADLVRVVDDVANVVENAVRGHAAGREGDTLARAAREIVLGCANIGELRHSVHMARARRLAES
jgi:predicted acyltransferase (DUF342 family)